MKRASLVLLLLAFILNACADDSVSELTARAERDPLGTQVAIQRATVTFETDRLQITLRAAEAAATQAARRQLMIVGTLVELGLPQPDLLRITPRALPTLSISDVTETPDALAGGVTRSAPTVQATPTLRADVTIETLPTGDPDAPLLENAVTSTGVGSDDCALGVTNQFSTSTGQIYVVMNARRIQPGDVITSRWLQGETQVASFDFVPDFAIDGPCIWFFADQTDFSFAAGSYRIELLVNSLPAAPAVAFSVE